MSTELFIDNLALKITRLLHYDESSDKVTIETEQDVTAIVEENKRSFNAHDERTPWNTEDAAWNRVASIPLALYYDLKRRGILTDRAAMRKWLNDPDNRLFRTRPGKV